MADRAAALMAQVSKMAQENPRDASLPMLGTMSSRKESRFMRVDSPMLTSGPSFRQATSKRPWMPPPAAFPRRASTAADCSPHVPRVPSTAEALECTLPGVEGTLMRAPASNMPSPPPQALSRTSEPDVLAHSAVKSPNHSPGKAGSSSWLLPDMSPQLLPRSSPLIGGLARISPAVGPGSDCGTEDYLSAGGLSSSLAASPAPTSDAQQYRPFHQFPQPAQQEQAYSQLYQQDYQQAYRMQLLQHASPRVQPTRVSNPPPSLGDEVVSHPPFKPADFKPSLEHAGQPSSGAPLMVDVGPMARVAAMPSEPTHLRNHEYEAADSLLSLSPRQTGMSPLTPSCSSEWVSSRLAGECVSLLATPDLVDLCPSSLRMSARVGLSAAPSQATGTGISMWASNKRMRHSYTLHNDNV